MSYHKSHLFCRHIWCCDDQVAFVLAGQIVEDDNEFAIFYCTELSESCTKYSIIYSLNASIVSSIKSNACAIDEGILAVQQCRLRPRRVNNKMPRAFPDLFRWGFGRYWVYCVAAAEGLFRNGRDAMRYAITSQSYQWVFARRRSIHENCRTICICVIHNARGNTCIGYRVPLQG